MRRLLISFAIATAIAAAMAYTIAPLSAISNSIVISQVYGGGGNAGATLKNDFIELLNRGTTAQSLNGWSVQYAAAAGTSWQATPLTNVTLQPGQYYLIQESAGAGGTTNLPTPDATGGINMSATTGKVALVNATALLTGSGCPFAASVVDVVGFGSTANCVEGAGPTATLTNTTAALRVNAGCTDTDNNNTDFSSGGPVPRNTASAVNTCGAPTNPTGVGSASPSSLLAGNQTLLSVTVTPGANPASTDLTVSANLSSIGGPAAQALAASGNLFSFQATVSASTTAGLKTLPVTITDAQGRTGSASISLTVIPLSTPPTGVGTASPNNLQAGNTTLLTVSVASGTNPVSTGLGVVGDLSAIGGAGSQPFFDNATNGDVTSGDNVFSFQATVASGTSPGAKSLPITVTDAQTRASSAEISLTVQPPPPPTTVKISQVYGGGGNSGSTYTNDFIEIFNQDTNPIDLTGWSVQYKSAGATGSWSATPLCPLGSCTLAPGHYFLVHESQGAGGTTSLPTPDATGTILMSGTNAKVALVNSTTVIGVDCPANGSVVDLVGYGSATCFETLATPALSNTSAAVRKGNGCVDTDSNFNDFVTIGPIPRNSAAPANSCGGDPSRPSGLGLASPASLLPAAHTLLTVRVTPATTPASTGVTVSADLSSIGGAASQLFYDDGTHGDQTAGDNVFSFQQTVGPFIQTGTKNIVGLLTDAHGHTATAPITLTVESPTCGVERWSIKVGTDPSVGFVDLSNHIPATIEALGLVPPPAESDLDVGGAFSNARVTPIETTVYVVDATITFYKKEADVDYDIVLDDGNGHTLISEIPSPACIITSIAPRVLVPSPLSAGIANAREKFDARLTALTFFQTVSIPVRVTGVGFFDFEHGQTGVAPNAIELHPVLDISFRGNTTTTLMSGENPSQYGQAVTFTATVTNDENSTPTGSVTFFDAGDSFVGTLDASGKATFTTSTLSAGSHSITASYEGDSTSLPSMTAQPVVQVVSKADQTISMSPLAGKTFGDSDFSVSATASSGLPVTLSIVSGPATLSGDVVHLTGIGLVTIRASQGGNRNYNAAADVARTFQVIDTAPPVISSVRPSVTSLWPPNKKMIPVTIGVTASDLVDPHPACQVIGVTSNEGSSADWQITGPMSVNLRADRAGNGTGRTYVIAVRCADASGNASTATTTVTVPHDQGK